MRQIVLSEIVLSLCVWFRGNIPSNFALWRGFEYPVLKNIRFFFFAIFFFLECFVCRDLTINLNFITLTPLAHLTWVCTAPSSGQHAQEHKGTTRPPWSLVWVFIFLCCKSLKTGSQGKTAALGLNKHCSVSFHNVQSEKLQLDVYLDGGTGEKLRP